MTAGRMSERSIRRVAGVTAGAMGGALVVASLVASSPAAAAAVERAPRPALAALESSGVLSPSTTVLFMARGVQSPCEAATDRYRAAQAALSAGDIDAANDVALIAQVLIAECGWTPVDAALGGPHGN